MRRKKVISDNEICNLVLVLISLVILNLPPRRQQINRTTCSKLCKSLLAEDGSALAKNIDATKSIPYGSFYLFKVSICHASYLDCLY